MKKKHILLLLCMATTLFILCACGETAEEMAITLSEDGVTVNGEAAEYNAELPVYLEDKTETHPDVPEEYKDVSNTVIHITRAGTYTVSGARANTRIAVDAGEKDEVTLVLDGADISCMTAPAVLVTGAKEPGKAGESGVTIELKDGTANKISGSHIARANDDDVKYDGAISSAVSLTVDGAGALELISDNEGIESKMHLTVNNGNITVKSKNDALNASNDGVSVITINDGYLHCHIDSTGEEGDGIDSNGTIVINGGTVLSYANANSQDSGLDADGGTTVNGGTVLACGNMMDQINRDSKQNYMQLTFKETQTADTLTVLTDDKDTPVAAFSIPSSYTNIQLSVPELKTGSYKLYSGGVLVADMKNGLAANLTSYSPGTQLQHGGAMDFGMRPEMGQPPEGMELPEGMEPGQRPEMPDDVQPQENMTPGERHEMPQGGERPQPPQGMERPEGAQPGGRGPGGMPGGFSVEISTVFEVTDENRMFMNITVAEE